MPEDWQRQPAKLRQKDRDARWTVKYSKAKPSADGAMARDNQGENGATIWMRICRRGGDEGRACPTVDAPAAAANAQRRLV